MTAAGFGRIAEGGGGDSPFDPARLQDLAQAEFGGDIRLDDLADEGLSVLCADLSAGAGHLSFMGKKLLQRALVETLLKRGCTDRTLAQSPPVPISAPILIVAPFRSGTTLLHRLWAQDPTVAVTATWQVSVAVPDPQRPETAIAAVGTYLDRMAKLAPALQRLHPTGATLPEECFGLLEPSFCAPSFLFWADLAGYRRWLDGRTPGDWQHSYRRYVAGLQALGAMNGGMWVLKSPFHLWGLQAVLDVVPDARVIQLHRDPMQVMQGTAALLAANRSLFARTPVRPGDAGLASEAADLMQTALRRATQARAALAENRFVDLSYARLVANPIDTMERLYERLDLGLSSAARMRMQAWLGLNPAPPSGSDKAFDVTVPPAFAAFTAAATSWL